MTRTALVLAGLTLTATALPFIDTAQAEPRTTDTRPTVTDAAGDLARFTAAERISSEHLKTFDTLDFEVFSNQRWDRLKESHGPEVKVHWPDGHVTTGIDRHIADLKYMFTYAPDTRIKVHPVKLGDGDWTAVVGVMEGTFTKPMTTLDGKVIQPTGKTFRLPMSTISHWSGGTMDEEYLFWDNQTYLTQLGLAG